MVRRLLVSFIAFIHLVIDKLLYVGLKWYWGPSKQRCPTLQRKQLIVTYSAVELATMIRKREVTCYEVVSAFIDRINEVNPLVNAVMDGPIIEALDEARRIDERFQLGAIDEAEFASKPFLGVPFTTKDSTAVKDRLHTLGIVARSGVKSNNDAECVRLMKEAGAIIIATTSIPEINRW